MKKKSTVTIEKNILPIQLTDAYHKARRSYGLFSGLLIAWELIGIELKEAPIQNFNIVFKSPQAAPYVLIVLVFYFAFRTSVEWYQSDLRRREMSVSKIDFAVAHFIAVAAIGLYSFQALLNRQIINFVSDFRVGLIVLATMLGPIVGGVLLGTIYGTMPLRIFLVTSAFILVGALLFFIMNSIDYLIAGASGALGFIGTYVIYWVLKRRETSRLMSLINTKSQGSKKHN